MAKVLITLKGTMTTTEAHCQVNNVDYTPATGKKLIISDMWICNKTANAYYGKVKIGGIQYLDESQITARKTWDSGIVHKIIHAGEYVDVKGEANNALDYCFSGVEVDI